jgi:hypothetical protein
MFQHRVVNVTETSSSANRHRSCGVQRSAWKHPLRLFLIFDLFYHNSSPMVGHLDCLFLFLFCGVRCFIIFLFRMWELKMGALAVP